MKKLLSLILAAVMLCGALAATAFAEESPFIDVKTTRWSYKAILHAKEQGYMDGVGGGKFDPAGNVTRAMAVTVLYRREGSPEAAWRGDFTDVKSGKYYSKAVIWAKDNGIVNGVTDTSFDPNGMITREQLAAILYRYGQYGKIDVSGRADLSVFPDAGKAHKYAKDALACCVDYGLISGVKSGDKTLLDPLGTATREQFATILKRLDETEFSYALEFSEPVPASQYTEKDYPLVENADVYVAVDGNDANTGTFDEPVATFNRAVERVREIKETKETGDIVVAFKAGDYGPLTVSLSYLDSGKADQRIVYCKYGDGDVIFNDGLDVSESEFTDLTDAEKELFSPLYADKIKKVDLSGKLTDYDPRTCLVMNDDGDCVLARFPNRYEDRSDNLVAHAGETIDDSHIVIDHPLLKNRVDKYRTTEGLLLYGYLTTGWFKDLLATDEYDKGTGSFHIPHPEQSRAGHLRYLDLDGFDSRYWNWTAVVNVPEELDASGEYWIDTSTSTMYVAYPKGDYHLTGGDSTMVTMAQTNFITFEGLSFRNALNQMISTNYCHDLTIRGCTFSGCSAEFPVSIMRCDEDRDFNILVQDNEFSYMAQYGCYIHLKTSTRGKFFSGGNVVVDNNLFTKTSLVAGNTAALSFNTGNTLVTHNVFKDCCWEGIDYRGAHDMHAEYNVFDRCCYNGDDTGAINNWSGSDMCGNLVIHNLFIDITGGSNGRYGLYLDGTAGTTVRSNLFYNCDIPVMNHDLCKYNNYIDNVSISLSSAPSSIACDTGAAEYMVEMMEAGNPDAVAAHEFYGGWKRSIDFYRDNPDLIELLRDTWPGYFDIHYDLENWDTPEFCLSPSLIITGNMEFSVSGDPVEYKDIVLRYSTVENNRGVSLKENPLFVNPTLGDYRIRDDVTDFPDIEFEKIGRY